MRIESVTIPHKEQRYPTTGDWLFGEVWRRTSEEHPERRARTLGTTVVEDLLSVRVSELGDWRYEFLVAVHEIIEAGLCKHAGIRESVVSDFDKLYEAGRANIMEPYPPGRMEREFHCKCPITDESEPGDDKHAPYYREHQIATGVERLLAIALGVSWNDYEEANLKLYE